MPFVATQDELSRGASAPPRGMSNAVYFLKMVLSDANEAVMEPHRYHFGKHRSHQLDTGDRPGAGGLPEPYDDNRATYDGFFIREGTVRSGSQSVKSLVFAKSGPGKRQQGRIKDANERQSSSLQAYP